MKDKYINNLKISILLFFLSEISSIILYAIYEGKEIPALTFLNAFIICICVAYCKRVYFFEVMKKYEVANFLIFTFSIILTGYIFDIWKINLEATESLPILQRTSVRALVIGEILPAIWMVYHFFVYQVSDNNVYMTNAQTKEQTETDEK